MSSRSIPIYPANIATFGESCIFSAPKTNFLDARGGQTRFDLLWNFTPIIFFSSLRIFYVKMATSEMGGILSCDRIQFCDKKNCDRVLHILNCDRVVKMCVETTLNLHVSPNIKSWKKYISVWKKKCWKDFFWRFSSALFLACRQEETVRIYFSKRK